MSAQGGGRGTEVNNRSWNVQDWSIETKHLSLFSLQSGSSCRVNQNSESRHYRIPGKVVRKMDKSFHVSEREWPSYGVLGKYTDLTLGH